MLEAVTQAVREIRAPVTISEQDLHALVSDALTQKGIPHRHEAMVAPRCRIDFLAGSVGIEIKRKRPNAKVLLGQLTRYLASPQVTSLLLIAERDPGLPERLLGKELKVISLSTLFGIALPEGQLKPRKATPVLLTEEPQPEIPDFTKSPSLPAYLKQEEASTRYLGTLSYQKRGNYWVIKGDPAMTEVVKRLFPGADSGKRGIARFSAHRRIIGEINWLMLRYPLAILPSDQERWDTALNEAQNHFLSQEAFAKSAPPYENTKGHFVGELRPFQQYGASWLCHTKRGLLADEMGLGKTVQTLAALASLSAFPAMIVVPPHLLGNWESEIKRFVSFNGQPPRIHVIRGLKPYPLPEADVYLIHYLLLRGWKEALPKVPVQAVIFDEIQELRHSGTEKYSAASLLSSACDRVYGLSGTPIYNQGGEIWNVVNILDYHFLGDFESFSREWCTGYGNHVVVHPDWLGDYLRREGLMLRRSKKEVLPELPDKRRLVTKVDSDDALMQKLMLPVIAELKEYQKEQDLNPSMRALFENRLSQGERQATGIAKAPFVAQFVRALLENGEKVLLFAQHHAVMDLYKKELKRFSPASITGRETQAQKEQAKNRFTEGRTDLLLISLRSASGLNLQNATCVVFGELDWSPAVHSQAEDRAHRIGQKDSLLCYYLVASAGSDSFIQDTLGLKVSQFLGLMGEQPILESEAMRSASLARQHVEDMLSRFHLD